MRNTKEVRVFALPTATFTRFATRNSLPIYSKPDQFEFALCKQAVMSQDVQFFPGMVLVLSILLLYLEVKLQPLGSLATLNVTPVAKQQPGTEV